jgi:hypothetical protein
VLSDVDVDKAAPAAARLRGASAVPLDVTDPDAFEAASPQSRATLRCSCS